MFALISPAKKLDFESEWQAHWTGGEETLSTPAFIEETQILIEDLKALSMEKIQTLMKLSDKLAHLNYNRYQRFSQPFTAANARPAILAFKGDTYVGLDAQTLSQEEIQYAHNHIGILSGLYGLLRPLDLMQAYRLEMGTKLTNTKGEDLYDFWEDKITKICNELVKPHKDKTIISLASNEYIKAIQPKKLEGCFITCHFKELKHGAPKVIGLFAKRARGSMARFIIQNRIETPNGLKEFKKDGYEYVESLSDEHNFVFLREQ